MRRVRIETYCSPHYYEQHTEVEGEGVIMAFGFAEPKVVDLCEECKTGANYDQLVEWLHAYGEEPEEPAIDSTLTCPIDPDGCNKGLPFKTLGGRNNHLRRRHAMTPAEAFA